MAEIVEKQGKARIIPPLPHAKWLKPTRDAWDHFWQDEISTLVKPAAYDVVETLFDLRDERARALKLARRQREATGSMGQPVVSPHAAYVLQLEASIYRLEQGLGIDPLSRSKLRLEDAQSRDVLEQLFQRAKGKTDE